MTFGRLTHKHPFWTSTMKPPPSFAALILASALFAPGSAWAGEGHDHGDAAPAAASSALPRFAAVSDAFELVGVLNGKQITLYLDRAADNIPVTDAQIELEIGATKLLAEKHGSNEFEVVLASEPKPGVLPITATVTVGNEIDLLAGELDIHEEAHADEEAYSPWAKKYAGWAAAAVAAIVALALISRRIAGSRQLPARGAA